MQMIRVLERLWDGKNLRKLNLFKEGTSDKAVEKPKKNNKTWLSTYVHVEKWPLCLFSDG